MVFCFNYIICHIEKRKTRRATTHTHTHTQQTHINAPPGPIVHCKWPDCCSDCGSYWYYHDHWRICVSFIRLTRRAAKTLISSSQPHPPKTLKSPQPGPRVKLTVQNAAHIVAIIDTIKKPEGVLFLSFSWGRRLLKDPLLHTNTHTHTQQTHINAPPGPIVHCK